MALRATKPKVIEKRLKALFYGPAGVGKTMAAIQFPRPYLIDTERGAENDQYVKALEKAGGVRWFTTDADELIDELKALLSEDHDYRTLAIDPLTTIYNDLIDKGIEQEGSAFGRYKIPADRKIKHMLNLLLRLDMNVIITSHAKPKWVRTKNAQGREDVAQDGMTFDCYARLDYLFDLVFEIERRGEDRVGVVRKSRVESFPEGEVFPFDFAAIAERYGREILERDAKPIALATPEQILVLNELLEQRKDGEDLREKFLKKAQADSLEEMDAEKAALAIDYLNGRKGETK